MNDLQNVETKGVESYIKRIFRHRYSYRGGGTYGNYGGYDITLLNLETSINSAFGVPACLPSPKFVDIRKSKLSGYGRYLRNKGNTCQTDNNGPYKYHYCDQQGEGKDICKSGSPPPQSSQCQQFFSSQETPDNVEDWADEVQVKFSNNPQPVYCYKKSSNTIGSSGWCQVSTDHYSLQHVKELPLPSWGFCSKDCYLDTSGPDAGTLRFLEETDVLPDSLCKTFLNSSLAPDTVVMPKILCVGHHKQWNMDQWIQENGKFRRMTAAEKSMHAHFAAQKGIAFITS